jgi:hypothetical protein
MSAVLATGAAASVGCKEIRHATHGDDKVKPDYVAKPSEPNAPAPVPSPTPAPEPGSQAPKAPASGTASASPGRSSRSTATGPTVGPVADPGSAGRSSADPTALFSDSDDFTVMVVNQNTIRFGNIYERIRDDLARRVRELSRDDWERFALTRFRDALESEVQAALLFDDMWKTMPSEQQEAARLRVEARIKTEIDELGSRARWQERLAARNLTESQVRARYTRDVVLFHAVRERFRKKIVIRPDEVAAEYDRVKDRHRVDGGIKFRVIEVQRDGGRPRKIEGRPAGPAETVDYISKKLKGGADFADLARAYSDMLAAEGGMWDGDKFVPEGSRPRKSWNEALAKLKPGQCTVEPVYGEGDSSWYFFKLEARREAGFKPMSEMTEEIETRLEEAKFQTLVAEELDRLKARSYLSDPPWQQILAAIRRKAADFR